MTPNLATIWSHYLRGQVDIVLTGTGKTVRAENIKVTFCWELWHRERSYPVRTDTTEEMAGRRGAGVGVTLHSQASPLLKLYFPWTETMPKSEDKGARKMFSAMQRRQETGREYLRGNRAYPVIKGSQWPKRWEPTLVVTPGAYFWGGYIQAIHLLPSNC